MAACDEDNVKNLLQFVENAPDDAEIIRMDCDDFCDQLAGLAERVAAGEDLTYILPALEEHMQYWTGCREEFEALVAILKAERSGTLAAPGLNKHDDETPSNTKE